MKALGNVKVSLYYLAAQDEYFVDQLLFGERSTSNLRGFRTSTECL
jgi:hypothetical protein